ncbi:MAG TPA: NAD(P)H-binding protein [Patescibacteria group bacterium]|nr:NAD(P)H-binding protein [Patescibacteria group bacterium]
MILVTGAEGFVGVQLLKRLSVLGFPVRTLIRSGTNGGCLRRMAGLLCRPAIADTASLKSAMQGVEQVIHLAGIFRESWKETFETAHDEATGRIMQAAREAKVRHVVYVSTLGAAPDRIYPFVRSKWLGEEEVRNSGLSFTILRPSLVFGEGDHFLTPLKRLLEWSPYAFIPGYEPLRCQPLWVGDLVSCLVKSVEGGATKGETIALAGPEQVTFEGVVDLVQGELRAGRPKVLLPLPLAATATLLLERVMGSPPLMTGVLDLWRLGAVTSLDAVQKAYGFAPMPLSEGVHYLLSSHGSLPKRRGRRERMVTSNRSI